MQKETEKQELREHRYLHDLIKRTGENFGLLSTVEEPTPDGKGRIDVALKRDDMRIAVEVAVTNTVTYEVKNIQKCLNAGYDTVVVCSNNKKHLEDIRVESEKAHLKNILFHNPDNLLAFIQKTVKPKESENVVKGYRVKVQYQDVDESERNSRGKSVAKAILRSKNT